MFMDPAVLLALCNLQSTDTVADFGAGSGFVARAAAKLVPHGNVFAVEINREVVTRMTRDMADLKLTTVHPLWGDIEIPGGSQLGDASADFIILSNVLFHLEDKQGCAKEALRVLKPGGRILIVDWSESFGGMGPVPTQVVPPDRAAAFFTALGMTVLTTTLPAGDHHYAILLKK